MGVFQIEARAQMSDAQAHPAREPRRPHRAGRAGAARARSSAAPCTRTSSASKRLREDPSYQVPYEHPSLEPVLRDTLGAIVFQDQVIEVAMAFAGFSAGEAEGLRRAMSRKRSEAAMRSYEQKFVAGAVERGAARGGRRAGLVADRRLLRLRLPEGALGGVRPARLPVDLAAGPLRRRSSSARCSTSSRWASTRRTRSSTRRSGAGIAVLPPCVARSGAECTVERCRRARVRLGLGYVNGVRDEEVRRARRGARAGRPVPLDRRPRRPLRRRPRRRSRSSPGPAPATRSCERGPALAPRSGALCARLAASPGAVAARRRRARARRSRAARSSRCRSSPHEGPELRALGAWERMLADYGSTGVTLREHPLELMRPALRRRCARARDLERGRATATRVEVAGLVVARQRPATAKGVTFMLLEDEYGTINLIVPPPVHDRCRARRPRRAAGGAAGRLERREGVDERASSTASSGSSAPTCRAPRSGTSSRAAPGPTRPDAARGRAADLRAVAPPATASAAAAAEDLSAAHGAGRRILVGTSSWADPGFVKEWYPPGMAARDRLAWYARALRGGRAQLELLRRPRARDRRSAGSKVTPDGFIFDVKVHRLLSRHAAKLDSLPPDMRDGVETNERGRVRPHAGARARRSPSDCSRRSSRWPRPASWAPSWSSSRPAFAPGKHELDELERPARGARARTASRSSCATAAGCATSAIGRRRSAGSPSTSVAFVCVDAPPGDHVPIMPPDRRRHPRRPRLPAPARPQHRGLPERQDRGRALRLESTATTSSRRSPGACAALAEQAGEVHVLFNNNRDDDAPTAARRFRALLGQDPGPPPEDPQLTLG